MRSTQRLDILVCVHRISFVWNLSQVNLQLFFSEHELLLRLNKNEHTKKASVRAWKSEKWQKMNLFMDKVQMMVNVYHAFEQREKINKQQTQRKIRTDKKWNLLHASNWQESMKKPAK